MQEESGLFQVRLNEQGKKFIRKFAAISYTILVLVIFENGVSIYWNIKRLITRMSNIPERSGYTLTFYESVYPYVLILFSLLVVISNIYYTRFPQVLYRSMKINDEHGANQAFGLLFRSAVIFLITAMFSTITLIWALTIR